MAKNLVLGAWDLLPTKQLLPFIKSLRATGYRDEAAIMAYRHDETLGEECDKLDIDVYPCEVNHLGQPVQCSAPGHPSIIHVMRFWHFYQFLATDNNYKNYNFCYAFDTRDVVFQNNPHKWFTGGSAVNQLNWYHNKHLIACSEAMTYDEPWNQNNMTQGWGLQLAEDMKSKTICNVGTLGGRAEDMMHLFLQIFLLANNNSFFPADQSGYNLLVHGGMRQSFDIVGHESNFACQCGTTLDPQKSHYAPLLTEPRPYIKDGVVYSGGNHKPFHVCHQYERVPELKAHIEKLYG